MQASSISPPPLLRGALRPRVEHHPPYVFSYGPEAIALAARAGLLLDQWQQDAITIMLGIRADGKYSAFEYCEMCSRQNGKGSILEARVLAGLFLLGEELIMWSAHEYKTAMEAFRRVLKLLRTLGTKINDNLYDVDGILVKVSHTNGEEGLERLDTGARLKFIARSKSSGRGFSGDVNIIDETFAYTAEQHAALMPTMSARPNPQIIYTSSPPLDGESGQILYQLRERGESGKDPVLAWRDWGLGGDLANLEKIDLGDPQNWAKTNPAQGIRITIEFIGNEHLSLPPEEFGRERLGIWPRRVEGAGGLFSKELWATMLDELSRRVGDVSIAIEVTPLRDYATVGLYGVREDGLDHVQLLDHRPGTDWLVARVVELKQVLDPVAIVFDAKNGAKAYVKELADAGIKEPENPDEPRRGDLMITDADDMALAVGQIIDRIRQKQLRHVGQQPLSDAVTNVHTRPLGDAVGFARLKSNVNIGPVLTVTLARYGHRKRLPLLRQDAFNVW